MPKLTINREDEITVVEEMKLLGIMIQSDMKCSSHVKYLTTKSYKRIGYS